MTLQYKALPAFTLGIDGRTVTGVFAVHGNVDSGGDRGNPGMFGDGMVNGRMRAKFLWQHDCDDPPIATIDRLFEIAAADLPPAVRLYAPDATGGTGVQRTYLDTEEANAVFAGIVAGAITEMSYAYETKTWTISELEGGATVRDLIAVDLFDISDVNWGMNPATSGTGAKRQPIAAHHEAVLAAVSDYISRYQELSSLRAKEGRVLSGESRKRIETALEALSGAADALRGLLAATEPAKADQAGAAEAAQLFAAFERTRAYLNGVLYT
jgi:hypothetical protein